jgi:hypothetical protein
VKPLFRDMQVYDPAQDKHKPVVRKMYEKVLSGMSKLLENRKREQVATKAQVSLFGEEQQTGSLPLVVSRLGGRIVGKLIGRQSRRNALEPGR